MKDETDLEYTAVADHQRTGDEATTDYREQDDAVEMSWSPGAILKRAREATNLDIADLSLQTKLPVRTLRALETDDFDALPEPVYVRGYYRRCAHALGAVGGEMVKAYERASGEPPPAPLPLKPMVAQGSLQQPNRWMPYALFVLIAAALVALLLVWGQPVAQDLLPGSGGDSVAKQPAAPSDSIEMLSSGDSEMTVPPTSSDSDRGSSGSAAFATTAYGKADQAAADNASAADKSAAQPKAAKADNARQASAATTESGSGAAPSAAAAAVGKSTLNVTFNKQSWVRIVDAEGTRLLNGLVPAGAKHELSGKPPFDVLLGYAPGVKLTLNGKPVSLDESIQSNNTAHIAVGESGGG